jgi:hypothetical protein
VTPRSRHAPRTADGTPRSPAGAAPPGAPRAAREAATR